MQSIRLIIPPELQHEEDEVLRKVRAGEGVHHFETIRVTKDGRRGDDAESAKRTPAPARRYHFVVRRRDHWQGPERDHHFVEPGGGTHFWIQRQRSDRPGTVIGASKIARDVTLTKQLERDARHFAAVIASSDDVIVSKTLDGTVVTWNPAAERLFGYTASEIVGRSIRLIVPSDRQAEEDRVLSAVRRGEVIDHFETVRQRKDGTLVPISLTVSPIRDRSGEIVGASKTGRDLSRMQRVQRDASRLAAIVDSSDDAIVGKDLTSIITSWNAAAQRMFGYSAEEMIGQSVRLLIPDDRQHEEDDVLSRIIRGQRLEHCETIRRRKDGTLIPVSLTVSPILNDEGVVIGASKIARDITDRVRADEERRRVLEMAKVANRLKDEFLATLSHELRTPLNAISGYARLMQVGLLNPEKQRGAIDTIVRNASSLGQMIEDVLDVSRIVSGKVRLNVQPVEMSTIVRESVETAQPAADAKSIRLDVIVDPRGTLVSGDPDRLRQILWNLCSNAIKFSDKGGCVQVRLERVNSHIEVTVSDNGIGISEEFLPHLFERFSQADAGVARLHGGLGLGLAICRHLVELQGGRISAHSDGVGQGSTFRVILPVRSVHMHVDEGIRHHPVTASHGREPQIPELNGIQILVVDDDHDSLALSREILEATGATVITADNGRDALEKLQRNRANVLIADLGMPAMDGYAFIAQVRQSTDPAIREIPAAALTAFARSEDRVQAMDSGFEVHLSKPIEPVELMAVVASLARRRRP
jgi:PAS domain S-box-containing protein